MQKKIIILCTVILIVVMEALFALIGALMPGPFTGTVTDAETNEPIANVSVSDGRNVYKRQRARKPRRRIIPSCKFPIQKLAQRVLARGLSMSGIR